jgi:hypothetical protein
MGRSGQGALRLLTSRRGWTDERELAHAIHGTIVGAAVMAAASLHGTLGQVVVSVVVTPSSPSSSWRSWDGPRLGTPGAHEPRHSAGPWPAGCSVPSSRRSS